MQQIHCKSNFSSSESLNICLYKQDLWPFLPHAHLVQSQVNMAFTQVGLHPMTYVFVILEVNSELEMLMNSIKKAANSVRSKLKGTWLLSSPDCLYISGLQALLVNTVLAAFLVMEQKIAEDQSTTQAADTRIRKSQVVLVDVTH